MAPGSNAFESLDEKPLDRFHIRAMFTTGMGVFTDGYDLSSIGLVLPLVLASFGIDHISGLQSGFLTGSALVGSVVGAVVFGALAQKGRKKYYGIDVGLMAVAAGAQAFAPNLWSLIAIRFVLGVGVGADYVLSPTIMAEHANRKDRGKTIGFGFGAMWLVGAIFGALILLVLRLMHVPDDLQWRIVLGFGMVPALSVLSLRRKMPETARFLARVGGESGDALRVIKEITGDEAEVPALLDKRAWHEVLTQHARPVFAAALLWMVYDAVCYSGILFGPSVIAKGIGTTADTFSLVANGLFALPGSLIGCLLIDRIGRKSLMSMGFVAGGLSLFAFAPDVGAVGGSVLYGFLLYGAYTFTFSLGPGTVSGSGILGVELAPTRIRSIAQGITVVGGRIGAATAAFVFPMLLVYITPRSLMVVLGIVAVVGAALTYFLVPETAGRSLEEINHDTDAVIAAGGESAVRAAPASPGRTI